jgi:DNA repair protein RadD
MALNPYPHQVTMLAETRVAFRSHRSVILQAPTGVGKTVMGTLIAQGAVGKGSRVMMTVHRDFLIDQTAEAFDKVGLEYGVIAPGFTPNKRAPLQIASIDTLKHRLASVDRPDFLIVDECHHSVAAGWAKIIAAWLAQGTKILGLTATPCRLDGRGLDAFYQHMVLGPPVKWLIANGFLSKYRAFGPGAPDLSKVHTSMGDYVQSEVEAIVDTPTITGDAIREYRDKADGKRAVAFAITIAHSEHIVADFNAAGIPAAHIDANTPRNVRKALLHRLRTGDLKLLSSVNIFGEGFDLPVVECAILLRPTQSLGFHLQQLGRVLRVAPGKDYAIINDHVGNLMNLGLPDTEYEWTLEGRPKKKKKPDDESISVKQCEACLAVFWPPPTCPYCGHVHETVGRKITEGDGDLVEFTPEMVAAVKKKRFIEVKRAHTMEALLKIEKERGYKAGWARHTFQSKKNAAQRLAEAQVQANMRYR